jgi:DNA-binding FadR family transcriptional regulator
MVEMTPTLGSERLHSRIVRTLARQVLLAEQNPERLSFPKEDVLSRQLGVSRTVLRESMKVLVDKGMVEMKPRAGTRARPRSQWRLLDPDILAWQAEFQPSPELLRNLCEVRLAVEPTAASFAAVRATDGEIQAIAHCLDDRLPTGGHTVEELIDLDLDFHSAVVAGSHNPLLMQLSASIRNPIRIVSACVARFASSLELNMDGHRRLLEALQHHDPMAARRAAEGVVGLSMLAVERVIQSQKPRGRASGAPGGRKRK